LLFHESALHHHLLLLILFLLKANNTHDKRLKVIPNGENDTPLDYPSNHQIELQLLKTHTVLSVPIIWGLLLTIQMFFSLHPPTHSPTQHNRHMRICTDLAIFQPYHC
jgi:hypothetical protein